MSYVHQVHSNKYLIQLQVFDDAGDTFESFFGCFVPEINVLRYVFRCARSVAHYPDYRKRDSAARAGLGDRGGFHVNGKRLWKSAFYFFNFFLFMYEFVATADETESDVAVIFEKCLSGVYYLFIRGKYCLETICSAIFRAGSTPYVMICHTVSDKH